MDERPRSERRRSARSGAPSSSGVPLFRQRDAIAVGVIAAVIAGSVAGIALLSGGSDEEANQAAAPTGQPTSAAPVFVPSNPDEVAIEALARRSIEVLPAGQWPSLYDDFSPDFQQRCPRQEFVDGGARNATELGANLPLLAYKRLEQVSVTGDTASAVVVGEIRGQQEYSIQASFQNVGGAWKLTGAPNTEGCAAFTRLSG